MSDLIVTDAIQVIPSLLEGITFSIIPIEHCNGGIFLNNLITTNPSLTGNDGGCHFCRICREERYSLCHLFQ